MTSLAWCCGCSAASRRSAAPCSTHTVRFPATASHAHRHGYLERPIVDEWLDVLGQVARRTWPSLRLEPHAFEQRVSHDVDWPSRYGFCSPRQLVRAIGGDILRRRDFASIFRSPQLWLAAGDALNPDELSRKIHARGHEIGLHPSYDTSRKPDAIRREAERLKRICADAGIVQSEWGGRMHFLRWQTPITLRGWVEAQITYDSSLGYDDRPGFRAGTCFEYLAFDPVRGEALALRVRPLIAMEATIIGPRYMALGTGELALANSASSSARAEQWAAASRCSGTSHASSRTANASCIAPCCPAEAIQTRARRRRPKAWITSHARMTRPCGRPSRARSDRAVARHAKCARSRARVRYTRSASGRWMLASTATTCLSSG
jgi:uncharacterized protein DUF7033